jgi:D-3-phosphoglycerate dehydrogenase / 2-oxoglutarate reductase
MASIVIAETIAAVGVNALKAAGHSVHDLSGQPREALIAALAEADALIVRSQVQVDAALIAAGPKLRMIGRAGVGIDNIDAPAAERAGILVVNAPDGNTIAAAEHTFALLLALARHVPKGDRSVREGAWARAELKGFELRGRRLGIVGLGRIGRAVAVRAAAFGMLILGSDPAVSPQDAASVGVRLVSLDELLRESDVVTLHAPAIGATPLIGAAELAKMQPSAVLINVARGSLVDEAALAAALASGGIAGAAIDVYAVEPPVGSPLLTAPRTVLTPHLGAQTSDAQVAVAREVAERICDFFRSA